MLAVQNSLVYSQFTMHDGFGIIFSLEMLSAPYFNTILHRYLFIHPQDLCYPDLVASVILFGKCLECMIQAAGLHFNVVAQCRADAVKLTAFYAG